MNPDLKAFILRILKDHRIMSVATLRPDGWPQVTTVGYASVGFYLYFLCGADSQKARNIAFCNKVSLTIDHDADDVMSLQGLSIAATAEFVTDEKKFPAIFQSLVSKYPAVKDLPAPDPKTVRYVRLIPKFISVLDYSKGFGHTDLVEIRPDDLKAAA